MYCGHFDLIVEHIQYLYEYLLNHPEVFDDDLMLMSLSTILKSY